MRRSKACRRGGRKEDGCVMTTVGEDGGTSRVDVRGWLGSDPWVALVLSEVEWIRMTRREGGWIPGNNCRG